MPFQTPLTETQNNTTLLQAILPRALDEKAAANYIGMSVSFLQKDRMNGALPGRTLGPRFAKLGKRVMYLRDDLDAWLEQHLVDRTIH